MAKAGTKTQPPLVSKTGGKENVQDEKSLIIQNITIRPAVRQSQDIQNWRNALIAADATIPNRTRLYDLYEDCLLDAHLNAVITKRIMGVTNHSMSFLDKAGKPVDAIMELMDTRQWNEMICEIMWAKMWGITLLEIDFKDGFQVFSVPRKHVRPGMGIVSYEQGNFEGINYRKPPYSNFVMEIGGAFDLGLMVKAAQYVIYKRGGFGDWAQYAEIFGMPFRVGKYDGYDDATRKQLEQALAQAGSAAYVVIPENGKIEFLEQKNVANGGTLYAMLKDACNDELSKLLLGQTETTTSSSSSGYAQSQTHLQQQDDINADDRKWVLSILNEDFRRIAQINGLPVEGGKWSFQLPEEKLSKKDKLAMDLQIAGRQPVDDDYFYNTYNVPKPANYKEQKAQKAQQKKSGRDVEDIEEVEDDKEETPQAKGGKTKKKARKLAKFLDGFFD